MDIDDEFFDDLDVEAIEQQAIASTQAARPANNVPSPAVEFDDEDVINLDDVQEYARPNYARPQHQETRQPQRQQDEVTAREQWRQQRYAPPSQHHCQSYQDAAQSQPQQVQDQVMGVDAQDGIDVNSLQARIAELEQQQAQAQKIAEDARAAYMSKAGEIAIVRANHDKTAKEFERRLAVMQQLHAEEVAKQRAELDRIRRDRDKVETDNRFLQHEVAQEAEKTKNVKRTLAIRPGSTARPVNNGRPSPVSTPKKDRTLAIRDGFDDDEVAIVSPTKFKEKAKAASPKGIKRKRTAAPEPDQSPVAELPMLHDETPSRPVEVVSPLRPAVVAAVPGAILDTKKFATMQMILNHRPEQKAKRTMEVLATLSLPSKSGSISSLIYDELALLPYNQDDDTFRFALCTIIMAQWSACLKESHYEPITPLSDMLMSLLMDSKESLSISLIPQLVPLCLATTDLIAVPTARAAKSLAPQDAPSEIVKEMIDPMDYLELLQLMAINCYPSDEDMATFWSAMEFDFVLIMLHRAQPLPQILQMLGLLSTSILPTSFGSIAVPRSSEATPGTTPTQPPQQSRNEAALVDRLIVLLFETPASLMPQQPQSKQSGATSKPIATTTSHLALANLRTQVLHLLTELAQSDYGGLLLATHRLAFGRLVRFLHDAIQAMYNYTVEPTPAVEPGDSTMTPHDHHTTHVNLTVLLLAHLTEVPIPTSSPPGDGGNPQTTRLDVRSKLAMVPSGSAKHLVSLSRIAFADGLTVIEKGIDPAAADAAHRMLDELLSPEEGENVMQVFGGSLPPV